MRGWFGIAFLLVAVVGFRGQVPTTASPKAVLQPILTVLDEAKSSASLEVSGRCDSQFLPDLQPLRAIADSSASPLLALREAFRDDSIMQITQDPDGMIRMSETGVPTDILRVRISHISFEDYAHNAIYNPNDAVRTILRTPEVVAFMKARNIEDPTTTGAVRGNAGHWPVDWPHLSGSLDNVLLSQALDHVLKTFPGIWLYEDCPQDGQRNRVVYFRFFSLRRMGSSTSFVEE
jgi:hypothetical protein